MCDRNREQENQMEGDGTIEELVTVEASPSVPLSQLLTDGDGVGIEADEVPAPQPRQAREQRWVGWWRRGHSSKKAVHLLVHLVEDAGAGLHLLLHGRGGGAPGTRSLLA